MLRLSEPAANPFRDATRRRFSRDMTALPRTRRLAVERRPPPFTTRGKGCAVDIAAHRGQGIELQLQVLRNCARPGAADGSADGSVPEKVKVGLEKFRSRTVEFGDQRRRGAGLGDKAVALRLPGGLGRACRRAVVPSILSAIYDTICPIESGL